MAGIYDNMTFPEYEFREYPKWVTPPGKEPMLVNDEDEEGAALAGEPVVREGDEKARLLQVAAVKGVQVDKRWAVERLSKAIVDAGHDPNLDPSV